MKKYIYLLACLLGCTACFDENPKSQLTEDEAFSNATDLYLNSVITLYNYIGGTADSEGLQGTYRGVYDYNTFTTDEALVPTRGADWYDGGFWQGLYLHEWTADDTALYNTWSYLYKVVVLCNQSIARLEQHAALLTEHEKLVSQGEVRAIRALFYYYLLDMFGSIPLCVSQDVALPDVKQSSRSEVFRFVVKELQEVLPYLPESMSQLTDYYYGRITRPVAWFLLMKLALNAEIYADDNWTDGVQLEGKNIYFTVDGQQLNAWQTVQAYGRLLTAFGYRLETDYTRNFARDNESSMENIFVIPMDKMLYATVFKNIFRSLHYNHGSALSRYQENGSCATVSTVRAYGYATPQEDSRFALNFFSDTVRVDGKLIYLDNGRPLVYSPLEAKLDLSGSPYEKTAGARMSKYAIDRTAYSDGQLQNNDIVLFRYADVLLMMAEANIRNGEDGSAELNQVRARVGMGARPATLDNVLQERLLELMWEGWRRQDLIRFRRFTAAYDERPQLAGESSGYTTVFPIPNKARELNKNLKQHTGYK